MICLPTKIEFGPKIEYLVYEALAVWEIIVEFHETKAPPHKVPLRVSEPHHKLGSVMVCPYREVGSFDLRSEGKNCPDHSIEFALRGGVVLPFLGEGCRQIPHTGPLARVFSVLLL